MPGKKKAKGGKSKGKAKGGKKKAGGGKKGKGKGKGKKSKSGAAEKYIPPEPDPFSVAAMINAYYISHGPVEFLAFRGYEWSGGGAKKKGKKGRKKK